MTTVFQDKVKCAVCGCESSQSVMGSTNAFGSPDLDLRPPQMKRSTMSMWLQTCPHCGYVAPKLTGETGIDRAWLRREEYLSCDGHDFTSELAPVFYRRCLIAQAEGNIEEQFHSLLRAAWCCDDAGDGKNACFCRIMSLEPLERMIAQEPENETILVLKADILRRAGRFAQVEKEYENIHFHEELLENIKLFQLFRAKARDRECYTVDIVAKLYEKL